MQQAGSHAHPVVIGSVQLQLTQSGEGQRGTELHMAAMFVASMTQTEGHKMEAFTVMFS